MEELLEILEGIAPGEDFENCTTLIDDHILDSFVDFITCIRDRGYL